jgi:hypothetical protein
MAKTVEYPEWGRERYSHRTARSFGMPEMRKWLVDGRQREPD